MARKVYYCRQLYGLNKHTGVLIQRLGSVPYLTHWGRVTHICVSKLTIIGSDNGLSPDQRQAIIWTNAGLLLIGPLGTNFCEILIEILIFSFKKMRLKVSSAKRWPLCLGLNVLSQQAHEYSVYINSLIMDENMRILRKFMASLSLWDVINR